MKSDDNELKASTHPILRPGALTLSGQGSLRALGRSP